MTFSVPSPSSRPLLDFAGRRATESPKSAPRSPKRVQKRSFGLFLHSCRTPGRTLWGLWGSPGTPFRTLLGLFRARRAGRPLCQAGGFRTFFFEKVFLRTIRGQCAFSTLGGLRPPQRAGDPHAGKSLHTLCECLPQLSLPYLLLLYLVSNLLVRASFFACEYN